MMPFLLAPLFALFPFWIAGCAVETSGNTSETTNGLAIVEGRITWEIDKLAVGAKVYLVENHRWFERIQSGESVVLDSAVTDSRGEFRLQAPTESAHLQVMGKRIGGWFPDVARIDSIVRGEWRLTPYDSVVGVVPGAEWIRFSGTTLRSLPSESGEFITALPPGEYTVIARSKSDRTITTVASIEAVATGQPDPPPQIWSVNFNDVVLDDFDVDGNFSTLGRLLQAGEWYSVADTESSVEIRRVSGEEAHSGKSLRIATHLSGSSGAWVLAGLFLGDEQPYDLSGLTAVRMRVRGTGTWRFSLFSHELDLLPDNHEHYNTTITPSEEWSEIRIPIGRLQVKKDSAPALQSIGWDLASQSITALRWLASSSENPDSSEPELNLDDIVLEGIDLLTFFR